MATSAVVFRIVVTNVNNGSIVEVTRKRPAGSEQRHDDMAPHHLGGVIAGTDPDERVEHLAAGLAAGIEGRRQKRADGGVGPRPLP